LALAGFMFHVHGSLLKIAANNFDLHVLSKEDRKILEWINHRFANAYDNCDLTVDLDMTTIHTKTLLAKCSNTEYEWFAAFVETNCRIGLSDLNPMSYFMQCAAGHFQVGDTLDEHTLLCACETKMIQWINDQSLLIAVVVGVIAFFEMILVFLSCYIMCTSTRRRYGYQEIRMPIKQRHPFNPHPRNFLHLHHTNNHTLQQQQQQQQQPLYPSSLHHLHTSYTTSTGTTSALPTNYHNKQDIQVIQHGTAI
jgi:hypothetical protein